MAKSTNEVIATTKSSVIAIQTNLTPIAGDVLNRVNETLAASNGMNPSAGIIDDEMAYWLELISYVFITGFISLLGCVANIINIIVFIRQKFDQTINISLFGLAISDLGSLLTLLWMSVCVTPWYRSALAPTMDTKSIQYLTAGWPHVCFARIASYITAFITFERCLCIALPLQVNRIITPRRTVIIVVGIFIVMTGGIAPVYYATRFSMVHNEMFNKSVLSFIYMENGPDIEKGTSSFNLFAQISSFIIVILCTTILVRSLLEKSKWRKSMMSKDEMLADKDRRVVKMVLFVAFIFIVCYLPSAANLLVMSLEPEYILYGSESNMFIVVWGFLNALEATNSSVNIFIYYHMSTKYRQKFLQLIPWKSDNSGEKD